MIDENQMFISSNEYAASDNLKSTKLTMILSETSYYIKNRQLPIAKVREIIFHNLLFTVICLELFRLMILLWKLTILPLLKIIMKHFPKTTEILLTKVESVDCETTTDDIDTTIDNHNTTADNHSISTTTTTTDNHNTTADLYDILELDSL